MQRPSSLLTCALSSPCPCPHTADSGQGRDGEQDFISLLISSLEHSFSNLYVVTPFLILFLSLRFSASFKNSLLSSFFFSCQTPSLNIFLCCSGPPTNIPPQRGGFSLVWMFRRQDVSVLPRGGGAGSVTTQCLILSIFSQCLSSWSTSECAVLVTLIVPLS